MSISTKDINEGVVSSISDTDLVMVSAPGGGYHPISFANLLKAVRSGIDLSKSTAITLEGGEWVRVAKANVSSFSAILSVSHAWGSGRPTPLVAVVNGSSANADGYNACQITNGSYYEVNQNPPASSNPGLSFTALRFVKEDNLYFVEVKFKPNAKTTTVNTSLAGQIGSVALVTATISNAAVANILKTIDFSGGGITNCQSASYALVGEKGGAHELRNKAFGGCVQECADSRLVFGSLDSLCQFIGRASEADNTDYPSDSLPIGGRYSGYGRSDHSGHLLYRGCDTIKQTACTDWLGSEPCGNIQARVVYHTTTDKQRRSSRREGENQHRLESLQNLPVHHGIESRKEVVL